MKVERMRNLNILIYTQPVLDALHHRCRKARVACTVEQPAKVTHQSGTAADLSSQFRQSRFRLDIVGI